jgi:hypothetical protein
LLPLRKELKMIRRNQGNGFGPKRDKISDKIIVTYAEEPW